MGRPTQSPQVLSGGPPGVGAEPPARCTTQAAPAGGCGFTSPLGPGTQQLSQPAPGWAARGREWGPAPSSCAFSGQHQPSGRQVHGATTGGLSVGGTPPTLRRRGTGTPSKNRAGLTGLSPLPGSPSSSGRSTAEDAIDLCNNLISKGKLSRCHIHSRWQQPQSGSGRQPQPRAPCPHRSLRANGHMPSLSKQQGETRGAGPGVLRQPSSTPPFFLSCSGLLRGSMGQRPTVWGLAEVSACAPHAGRDPGPSV